MLDHLFSPLAIGPAELRSRIVSTAHQTTLVHDHLPTEDFVAYQQARARGGTGLIVMEAVAIAPSGLLTAHTIGGYLDGTVPAYRRVAAAVQGEGTKLFVQLFHGGREVIATAPRPVIVSASALPSHRYHTEPRALRRPRSRTSSPPTRTARSWPPRRGSTGSRSPPRTVTSGSSSSRPSGTGARTATASRRGS